VRNRTRYDRCIQEPKPVLTEYKKFFDFLKALPFTLPKAKEDATCILSKSTDQWGVAYMSYLLAKQAGANINFTYYDAKLPDSKIYLLPSIKMHLVMPLEKYKQLKENVKNGADLYISNDTGILSEFCDLTGLSVHDSENTFENCTVKLHDKRISLKRSRKFYIEPKGAEVIATDDKGIPAFTKFKYGKGTVWYLNFPLESMLLGETSGFEDGRCDFYKEIFTDVLNKNAITSLSDFVGVTLHPDIECTYAVAVNYSDKPVAPEFKVHDGWKIDQIYYGNPDLLEPFGAAVIKMIRIF